MTEERLEEVYDVSRRGRAAASKFAMVTMLREMLAEVDRLRAALADAQLGVALAEAKRAPMFVDGPEEAMAIREAHQEEYERLPWDIRVIWELGYDSGVMDAYRASKQRKTGGR
jgi:hypothetical protein